MHLRCQCVSRRCASHEGKACCSSGILVTQNQEGPKKNSVIMYVSAASGWRSRLRLIDGGGEERDGFDKSLHTTKDRGDRNGVPCASIVLWMVFPVSSFRESSRETRGVFSARLSGLTRLFSR